MPVEQDANSRDAEQLVVPELGVVNSPIVIVGWLVAPGAELIAGERVAELLADSVLFHMESSVNGRLARILKGTGSCVEVGDAIAEVELS